MTHQKANPHAWHISTWMLTIRGVDPSTRLRNPERSTLKTESVLIKLPRCGSGRKCPRSDPSLLAAYRRPRTLFLGSTVNTDDD
jgi:hypothetical protein